MAHNRCTHTYRGTMLVYSTSLILPIWKGGPSASNLLSIRARGLGTGDEQTSSIGACRSVRWVRYSAQDSTSPLHFLNSSPAPPTSEQSTNKQCVCMFDKFYLTFDFKPKVSSDVIKNNQRMSIDVYIWFCEMSPQCRMLSSMCYSNFLPCQFACDYLTLQVALHVKF